MAGKITAKAKKMEHAHVVKMRDKGKSEVFTSASGNNSIGCVVGFSSEAGSKTELFVGLRAEH